MPEQSTSEQSTSGTSRSGATQTSEELPETPRPDVDLVGWLPQYLYPEEQWPPGYEPPVDPMSTAKASGEAGGSSSSGKR